MNQAEYTRRQAAACARLDAVGELENARRWIRRHRHDYYREGFPGCTPMEWAELEMPVGILRAVLRFCGHD